MPIYEYLCRTCDHRFETLVTRARTAVCPTCDGRNLEKQLSVFAVAAGRAPRATAAPGTCGRCGDPRGPGACSPN